MATPLPVTPNAASIARAESVLKDRETNRRYATMLSILSFMKMNFFGGLPSR